MLALSKLAFESCEDAVVIVTSLITVSNTCKHLFTTQYHRSSVAALAFEEDTGNLASAGRDKAIAFWSIYKEKVILRFLYSF